MIQNLIKFPVRSVEPGIYSCTPDRPVAGYDSKARLYEFLVGNFLYNKLMWGTSPADYRHFAKEVLSASEGSLLDIGCGGLIQTAKLYASRSQHTVLADISLQMLRIGKHRIQHHLGRLPARLTFLQADAMRLPFCGNSLDNIVSFGLLHLFEDKPSLVNEWMRVVRYGGSFHVTALTNDRPFSRKYIRLLQDKSEFAPAMSSTEIIDLFRVYTNRIQSYTVGSMVFISGIK